MLKGTEKQVKYANDIKIKMLETIDRIEETVNIKFEGKEEKINKQKVRIENLRNKINEYAEASDIIKNHKEIFKLKEVAYKHIQSWGMQLGNEYNVTAKVYLKLHSIIADEQGW